MTELEIKTWPCGCREEHEAGTDVWYVYSCDLKDCRRHPPGDDLVLTPPDE